MDSVKSKTKKYYRLNGKAIAQVVFVGNVLGFKMYVAWEWPEMADRGFFAIMKQPAGVSLSLTPDGINYVADYGTDITSTQEAKELFPEFFK